MLSPGAAAASFDFAYIDADKDGYADYFRSSFLIWQCFLSTGEAAVSFDFAYIDADKGGYADYFRLCVPLLRPGGVMAVDNTLFRVRNLYTNPRKKNI